MTPPAGWVEWCGELMPDRSVAGYLARGQEVRGFCRHQYCKRTCWIDVDRLVHQKMGGLPMKEAQDLWRCHRLGGCRMDFEEDAKGMLTLDQLAGLPAASVRLRCLSCNREWNGPAKGMAARLKKNGEGDGTTLVTEVGKQLRQPCGQCGQTFWQFSARWAKR